MWIKKLLLILCLCSVSYGANDFSGDGNCVALYRFESGALTTDSKGTNTLSANGTPTADAVDYKEGSGCVDLEVTAPAESYERADASLSADFPFKKDTANKTISLAFWCKLESAATWRMLSGKSVASNYFPYFVGIGATGNLELYIADGLTNENYVYGTTLTTGIWYHIGITYEDAGKTYRIRVWDDNAGALLGADLTGTGSKNAYMGVDGAFAVGGYRSGTTFSFDGKIDEFVVFNDVLTADEIDQIRTGTYAPAAPAAAGGQLIMIQEF